MQEPQRRNHWGRALFFFRHFIWNIVSLQIFAHHKILQTGELCRLKFTYVNRQLIPWRLSTASEESEMRAAGLLVNRNIIVAKKVLLLERENKSRKRESHEKEEDEETGGRVGRSSGRGRAVRRPVGGRESKKKRNDEEAWTSLGRSKGREGRSCCGWTANSMRAGKSAMSSFEGAILATICRN